MIINSKMLSLPPYLSASWSEIQALHQKGDKLVIVLRSGGTVEVPGLTAEVISRIFAAHAAFVQHEATVQSMGVVGGPAGAIPLNLGTVLEHNPEQAHAPDLPREILDKVTSAAKLIALPEDPQILPKAEPHCNCMHCQVARAMRHALNVKDESVAADEEEIVDDKDLTFQEWEITQTGEKLFTVVNKLDNSERYTVFLGNPVGCTCGKMNCEHVIAVLRD